MSHKSEVEACRELIEDILHGRFYLTHQSGRLHGSAGILDAIVLMNHTGCFRCKSDRSQCLEKDCGHHSLMFWLEIKVGRDKLRPAQVEFKALVESCGGTVIVGGVAEVIAHLRANGYKVEG